MRAALLLVAVLAVATCSGPRPTAPAPPAGSPGDAALGYLVNAANDAGGAADKFIDPRLHPERGTTIGNWASDYGGREDSIRVDATSAIVAGPAAGGGAALVTFSAQSCDRDRFGGRSCTPARFQELIPTVRAGGHWYVSGQPFPPDEAQQLDPVHRQDLVFTPAVRASDCATGNTSATSCVAQLTYTRGAAYTSPAASVAFAFVDQTQRFACLPTGLGPGPTATQLQLAVTCPRPVAAGDLVRVLYSDGADEHVFDAANPSQRARNQATYGEFSTTTVR